MKTFQMDGRPDVIEFTNYDRIDELELFKGILSKLQNSPDVEIGKKEIGPSEDYYHCFLSGKPFMLIYDLDYGTRIWSDQPEVIDKLIKGLSYDGTVTDILQTEAEREENG